MTETFSLQPGIGAEALLSAKGVAPTSLADSIGDIEAVPSVVTSVSEITGTPVNSKGGYVYKAPGLKTVEPFTFNIYRNRMGNPAYLKLAEKFNSGVGATKFYCRITFVLPSDEEGINKIPDYSYDGFISSFSTPGGDTTTAQIIAVTFTPTGAPVPFAGLKP